MKKLFFVALAAVAMTFTACKNDKPATDQPQPQENTEVAEVNYTDSLNAALEAKDASKIEQFVNDIKEKVAGVDAAKFAPQLEAVQNWLKENTDKVKEVLGDKFGAIVDPVANFDLKSIAGEATEGVENAVEDVKNAGEEVVEGAKSAVEDVKATGEQVVEDAKASVEKTVEDAKQVGEDLKNVVK